jgi:competence protein ComEC
MRLIVLCAALLVGIAIADLTRLNPAPLVLCAALAALAALLAWAHPPWRTLALVACAASLGGARASLGSFGPSAVAPGGWLAALRQSGDAGIHAYLPEPQASLAAGVVLGGSGRLDSAFRLDLQRSGLAHLVAIDGFKQVIMAAAVGGVARWVAGARAGALTSVLAVTGYTLLTGAHPSAVRAGLMVGLASLGALSGRVADPLTSLLVAVSLMATLEPRILLDLGLQLSLSATLGIVLLWPRFRRHLRRWPRLVAEPIGLTLAVTLASLPVALCAFQMVSLISPVAHVVAVPLLAPVLLGAALLAVCASAAPLGSLASVAAWLAWLPTSLLVWVIHAFGSLPAASVSTGRLPVPAAVSLAGALLGWGIWGLPELRSLRADWHHWHGRYARLLTPGAYLGVCLAALLLLNLVRPDGRVHVETLDVGRGQATFIRGPGGRTALVVAGHADAVSLLGQVGAHLAVWEHRLNTAVALDSSAHKALGLTLARYPADQLIDAATPARLDMGGGAALDVTAPDGHLLISDSS